MKSFVFLAVSIVLAASALVSPHLALAECAVGTTDIGSCFTSGISDANNGESTINLSGGLGFSSLPQAIQTVVTLVFIGAGLLVLGYLLYGAITYISVGDDSSRANQGRQRMISALIGLIVLALIFVTWLLIINLIPGVSDFFASSGSSGNSDAPNCTNQGTTIC